MRNIFIVFLLFVFLTCRRIINFIDDDRKKVVKESVDKSCSLSF